MTQRPIFLRQCDSRASGMAWIAVVVLAAAVLLAVAAVLHFAWTMILLD